MRNGGYRGIYNPSSIGQTTGMHTARDQFEKTKQFGGKWFSPSSPIYMDDQAPYHNRTINSTDTQTGEFSFTTSGNSSNLYSSKLRGGGKFYYELRFDTGSGTQALVVGPIVHQTLNGTQMYNQTNANFWYMYNGTYYPGATSSVGSFQSFPELLRVAYDMNAGKMWFGANDTWSPQSGAPGVGSGLTIFGYSSYGDDGNYRAAFSSGSSSAQTFTGQYLTGTNIVNPLPDGFSAH